MPAADKYTTQTFFNPAKSRPKVAGLSTPRFTPQSIFAGRPTENMDKANSAIQGGLAGLTTQVITNPYSTLFLFKGRR